MDITFLSKWGYMLCYLFVFLSTFTFVVLKSINAIFIVVISLACVYIFTHVCIICFFSCWFLFILLFQEFSYYLKEGIEFTQWSDTFSSAALQALTPFLTSFWFQNILIFNTGIKDLSFNGSLGLFIPVLILKWKTWKDKLF